jgi:hypothetical protein
MNFLLMLLSDCCCWLYVLCIDEGSVEAKHPDKTLRLASERTGLEGMVEATTWHQVFCIAAERSAAKDVKDQLGGREARRDSVSVRKDVTMTPASALKPNSNSKCGV